MQRGEHRVPTVFRWKIGWKALNFLTFPNLLWTFRKSKNGFFSNSWCSRRCKHNVPPPALKQNHKPRTISVKLVPNQAKLLNQPKNSIMDAVFSMLWSPSLMHIYPSMLCYTCYCWMSIKLQYLIFSSKTSVLLFEKMLNIAKILQKKSLHLVISFR